jgi:pectate lyase
VFDTAYSGNVKLNNVSYTVTNGVAIIPSIPAGTNVITKGSSSNLNLYYIKTVFGTLRLADNVQSAKLILYPNPVTNQLYFSSSDQKIENVTIYNLTGALVKTISNVSDSIDISNLTAGSYLVKTTTDQGSFVQKIIKN